MRTQRLLQSSIVEQQNHHLQPTLQEKKAVEDSRNPWKAKSGEDCASILGLPDPHARSIPTNSTYPASPA